MAERPEGAPSALPIGTPFIGRGQELRHLDAALGEVAAGRGQLLLIGGEPGIGKTRLAEEAAVHAVAAGFSVSWGSCWEGARTQPFWPWTQALRDVARRRPGALGGPTLGRILAGPAARHVVADVPPEDAASARLELFDAVLGALGDAAAEGPLLIVLDDLQWADPASLSLTAFVARNLRRLPVAMVATHRSDELASLPDGEVVAELVRLGRHVPLSGMVAEEIGEMAAAVTAHACPPALARALHTRSGGNPFFASELARLMDLQGGLDAADPDVMGLPPGVQAVIDRRLARLDDGAIDVMSQASVLGTTFAYDLLGSLTGEEPGSLLSLLAPAAQARVVVLGASGGSFAHALLRDTLLHRVDPLRRRELHQRAAAALDRLASQREVDPAELARHTLLGGQAPSPSTLGRLRAAAEDAMGRLAYEDAAHWYAQAADHDARLGGRDALRLLGALGDAHLAAGNLPEGRAAFEALAVAARQAGRPDELARAALGMGSGSAGFEVALLDTDQIALLEEALGALPPGPAPTRAWLLARLSVALSYRASEQERLELATQAVVMARAAGDDGALAYALAAYCDAVPGPAHAADRERTTREMLGLAERRGSEELALMARRLRIVALLETGRLAEVDDQIDAYARTRAARHQPLYGWYVPAWRAMRALMAGRMTTGEHLLDEAEALGSRAQSANASIHVATQRWCLAADVGRDRIAHFLEYDLTENPGVWPHVALALTLALAGRVPEARARFDLAAGLLAEAPHDGEWLSMMAQAAQVVDAIGGHPIAPWLYEALLPHRDLTVVEGAGAAVRGVVHRYLGLLAANLGRPGDAAAHFRAAQDAAARIGATLVEASILRDWGRALHDRARLDAAAAMDASVGIVRAGEGGGAVQAPTPPAEPPPDSFRREGQTWLLTFGGRQVRLRDTKGLRDLAILLRRPGRAVGALDLARPSAPTRWPAGAGEPDGSPGDLGEVLDDHARRAFRRRIVDLEAEIAESEEVGDPARAGRARAERDTIVATLAGAYGLGGRARRTGHPAERARSTVTARIRDAIRRIEGEHPELGRHLRRSVKTGTFCVYDPPEPRTWAVDEGAVGRR